MNRVSYAAGPAVDATFWRRLAGIIVCGGVVLTTLVAEMQHRSAEREAELLFGSEADRIQQSLVDTIEARIQRFEASVRFIEATHPGPLDDYMAFMEDEAEVVANGDPGVLFFESVPIDEIDGLAEREARLGNTNFEVTLFPAQTDQRIILTRFARESSAYNVSLMGLDITSLSAQLLPADYGNEEVELYVLESSALTSFVEVDKDRAGFEDLTAMLLGVASNPQGEQLGILVKIDTVSGLVEGADTGNLNGLEFALSVGDEANLIGGSVNRLDQPIEQASLVDERTVETAGLTWRIDVWAPSSHLDGTGITAQWKVWLAGLGLIAAARLLAWRRQLVRLRLDSAHFELEHARTLASTDALTGLLNRNGLVDAARSQDRATPATLFFIDLDGFKKVNDSEGHERGDQLLRAVANELRGIFRADDLVCRIGGDEFVVFARRSAPQDFMKMASQRITEGVASIDERVTCSVGVSSRGAGSRIDVKDMLRSADAAMYEAKRNGGDRYEVVGG